MSRLSRWLRSKKLYPVRADQAAYSAADLVGRHRLAPPLHCDVTIAAEDRASLFARVASSWKTLGDVEPYWSVRTEPGFRMNSIAKHEDDFYDAEASGAALLKAIFARNGEDPSTISICVELGCGVGRTTATLSQLIPNVIGLDISAPHLKLAAAHFVRRGIRNVELRRVASIEDLAQLPAFDLFFSEIVLQHNPPPVIAAMLEQIFERLARGGFCLFQVPTYLDKYRFDAADYLKSKTPIEHLEQNMEMHILPQRVVFRLMRDAGIDLIEVFEDNMTGHPSFQSMTFFGRKSRNH